MVWCRPEFIRKEEGNWWKRDKDNVCSVSSSYMVGNIVAKEGQSSFRNGVLNNIMEAFLACRIVSGVQFQVSGAIVFYWRVSDGKTKNGTKE